MAVRPHIAAKSIRAMAPLVGRAENTVRKWLERDDWPRGVTRVPPWTSEDVARIRAWAEIFLKPDPAAAYRKKARQVEAGRGEFAELGALTKARLQGAIERALLTRQRRMIEAGRMHDVETCQNRRLVQILAVRTRLLELPRLLAHGLVGRDAAGIERILAEQVDTILEEFAADDGAESHGTQTP